MTQSKTILISTLATSLLVLAGCTTQSTTNTNVVNNTNTTVNTNTSNDNTNAVVTNSNENANEVVNENTNADQGSEVDTSDWLTYTSEEYGFSFKYPSDWSIQSDEGELYVSVSAPNNFRNKFAADYPNFLGFFISQYSDIVNVEQQWDTIKCQNYPKQITCTEHASGYGNKYVELIENTQSGPELSVLVPTGKGIILFNLQFIDPTQKESAEVVLIFETIMSSIKI